ncbi:MAG: hypothetical protein CMB80_22135 [Flammeovirgaceae bacterium]|nr:hypothetical protein [Flammeovirgaceae bacterium]MBR06458.1 hypothetical protein [Rickettsiales bacterium]HCX21807.1 hypothetical protein [Cytophagales bacterium]|tara:strand:+ start:1834 stop:2670 length:837 start_codon:yes stop_codon:yes gene_type:complete
MRLESFRLFVIVCLFGCTTLTFGQDLFDYSNSKKYADYLFEAGRYDESATEYERVVYLNPTDTTSWHNLLISMQNLELYQESIRRLKSIETVTIASIQFGKIHTYALFSSSQFEEIRGVVGNYTFTKPDLNFLTAASLALEGNWESAQQESEQLNNPPYLVQQMYTVASEAQDRRHKSPFLAGALSTVVPGLGKIYTGRWKDGLFSLLLISTTGYQAYRIISEKGIDRPGAWIFGGLALGFYTGNIYGSVKSAQEFNQIEEKKYEDRVQYLLDIYYGR